MAIPANIIVGWPNSEGTIPTGWVRVAALNDVYIAGAAPNDNADVITTRGNASHTHTSPPHTPVENPHTHNINATTSIGTVRTLTGLTVTDTIGAHTHPASTMSAMFGGGNNPATITVDAVLNDLLNTTIIWIASDGTPSNFPTGSVLFWDNDTLPSGWTRTLTGYYLKGAAAAATGGEAGGSNTHTHISPAHAHSKNSHYHTGTATPSASAQGKALVTTPANNAASYAHTHIITTSVRTITYASAPTITIAATNHEPVFKYLNAITPTSADSVTSLIAIWGGMVVDIPTDWTRYTAMDSYWLKCAIVDGDVLTTGGASSHSHTADQCTPIDIQHQHTGSSGAATTTGTLVDDSVNTVASIGHTHSAWNSTLTTTTNQPADVLIDVCGMEAAYPPHRTIIFVQLVSTVKQVCTTTYELLAGNREDLYPYDLTRAAYRTRRRGEG